MVWPFWKTSVEKIHFRKEQFFKKIYYTGEMLSDIFVNSCMRETMMTTRLVWVR